MDFGWKRASSNDPTSDDNADSVEPDSANTPFGSRFFSSSADSPGGTTGDGHGGGLDIDLNDPVYSSLFGGGGGVEGGGGGGLDDDISDGIYGGATASSAFDSVAGGSQHRSASSGAAAASATSSSMLGLTSMDFWSMDDVKPFAVKSENEQGMGDSALFQNRFATLSNAPTPDAVMAFDDDDGPLPSTSASASAGTGSFNSRAFQAGSATSSGFTTSELLFANNPGDHRAGSSSVPSSAYASPENGFGTLALQDILGMHNFGTTNIGNGDESHRNVLQQGNQFATSTQFGFDPNGNPFANYGTLTSPPLGQGSSSAFNPSSSSATAVSMQGQQQQQGNTSSIDLFPSNSADSSPSSPRSILQQLASSNSGNEGTSSSSRSSSHDPPPSNQQASGFTTGYPYQQQQTGPGDMHHLQFATRSPPSDASRSTASGMTASAGPGAATKTPSSASSTRTHTAKNSPPSTSAGFRVSKSATSLSSMGAGGAAGSGSAGQHARSATNGSTGTSTSQADAMESQQISLGTQVPDKASQQQASESASFLKSVSKESAAAVRGHCQLLILGLPDEGARSRVETQVKLGLILVRPRTASKNGKGRNNEDSTSSGQPPLAMSYRDAKGALMPEADQHFERVGAWKYISLPAVSSVKRNAKKHHRSNIPKEQTLFAEIKVVSATNPSREIYICQNCQQREIKRLQRKTQNRSKPTQDVDSGKEDEIGMSEMELAKKKIVLFNCGQFLDFNMGEVVVPTRITCYCRHHKEKYGFNIVITLTDHLGNPVASSMSPPVFLTDDHKARPTKPDSLDLKHMTSLAEVANGPSYVLSHSRNGSQWNSAASSMPSTAPSSQASSQASSAANSARPSRNNSVDNLEALNNNSTGGGAATGGADAQGRRNTRERSGKPYSLEQRPKVKRNLSMNRLNSFTMTPLSHSQSVPNSPRHHPVSPLTSTVPTLPSGSVSVAAASSASASGAAGAGGGTGGPSDYFQQASGPLMDYLSKSKFTAATETHASPGSSLSAPSTPGASLESYGSSWPNQGAFPAAGSVTSQDEISLPPGLKSVEQSPAFAGFVGLPTQTPPGNIAQSLAQLDVNELAARIQQQQQQQQQQQTPQPKIMRIIPNEGPTHGGIEVILLGENFSQGLEVTFGESSAVTTQIYGGNTLVCILPPSPTPGPVVVGFRGRSMGMSHGNGIQLFTYLDTSDKALMELALQVVGMKMTGRIDDARNVARRIIGTRDGQGISPGAALGGQAPTTSLNSFAHPSLAPSSGNGISSVADVDALQSHLLAMDEAPCSKDFQSMVIRILSLDLAESATPDPSTAVAYDLQNVGGHTLLHLATMLGMHRLIHFLIERGARHDIQDKTGHSPLHLAALCGRVAAARALLAAGAQLFVRNHAGDDALEIARSRDQPDVEELFHEHLKAVEPQGSETNSLAGQTSSLTPNSLSSYPVAVPAPANSYAYSCSPDSDASYSSGEEYDSDGSEVSYSDLGALDDDSSGSSSIYRSIHASSSAGHASTSTLSSLDDDEGLDGVVDLAQDENQVSHPHCPLLPPPCASGGMANRLLEALKMSASIRLESAVPHTLASWRSSVSQTIQAPKVPQHTLSTTASSHAKPIAPSQVVNASKAFPRQDIATVPRLHFLRRLGYSIDNLTEDALRSYSYHAQKYGKLRRDRMLYLFWLPLLVLASIWLTVQVSSTMQALRRRSVMVHMTYEPVAAAVML